MSPHQLLDLALVLVIGLFAFGRLIHSAVGEGDDVGPLNMVVWLMSTYWMLKGVAMLVIDWFMR